MLLHVLLAVTTGFMLTNAQTNDEACTVEKFSTCMEQIQNASVAHPKGLFQDVGDLYESCPAMKRGMECVQDYAKTCGTELIAENFEDQFLRPMKLISEICNADSPIRYEYLRQSKCMLDNKKEFDTCFEKIQEFLAAFDADTESKEKTLSCMYEMLFRSCLLSAATNSCGLEAGNVVRTALMYSPASGMKLCFDEMPL